MIDYAGTNRGRSAAARADRVEVGALAARLDWVLLLAVAGAVAYGLWAIGGITRHDIAGNPDYYVLRQGLSAAVGMVGLAIVVLIDPRVYHRYKRGIYLGTLALMLLVFLGGEVARGSKRWIDLGFFRFQPSEFAKLLVVLAIAGYLADQGKRISSPRVVLTAIGLAAIPVFLVFLQPDLGTALVYGAALAAVLFVAGTRWLHLAVLGIVSLLGVLLVLWWLPSSGVDALKPYQQQRFTAFLHPNSEPQGVTYNVNQSETAVGAGGLRGRGVSGATQTSLNYLPAHATDFAFASLAEQRGFLGAAFLLLLYLLVVWRGLKVVTGANDLFSAIVAGGIVFSLLFQIFVNVGMTMGIAPITGVPLPFVSVGGSSLVANLLAIGVLEAIYARGRQTARRAR
jgi:rod shape determining protein RodA